MCIFSSASWKRVILKMKKVGNTIIQESLGELVANQLRKSIWNREIQLGARLIESDLAEQFNVSRSTIRDALKILEHEEMVVIKQRKGTYVSEFTPEDYQEILQLRVIIESYAFVKALTVLNDEHITQLEAILEEMKRKVKEKIWSDLFDLDIQFHSYVINLCGNSRVIKIYNSLKAQIRTCLIFLDSAYTSFEAFYEEQKKLLDALKTKDPEIVEKEIRDHIMFTEKQIVKLEKQS